MSGKRFVIKFGGSALSKNELGSLADDLRQLQEQGDQAVLVHGGGPELSRLLQTMGHEARWVDGLRVTDEVTMEAAEMVLAGKLNKQLVSLLARCRAVGLTGVDGQVLRCGRMREELGLVGRVEQVDTRLLELLLDNGFLPVLAPIGLGPGGERLNLNADTAAAAVARALGAERIVFLTDVPGVLRDGNVIRTLTNQEAESMIANGIATGGMIPKLRSCQEAALSGVPAQILGASSSLLAGLAGREGTLVTRGS